MLKHRRLEAQDAAAFHRVTGNAYPGFTQELREKVFAYRMAHPDLVDSVLYGTFDGEMMQGAWRFHRYDMNFRGQRLPVCGLGGVAVDMPFKKQKVCLTMVSGFHHQGLAEGYALALLYPFRASFYHQMGYGVCTHVYQHHLRLTDLPKGDKSLCGWIDDDAQWLAYYNKVAERTHGMFLRPPAFGQMASALGFPPKKRVGVWREGTLHGCMEIQAVGVSAANPFHYHFEVKELLYDEPSDLRALLAFLRDQEDQAESLVFYTFDPEFALSLEAHSDPVPGENILDEFHIGERKGYGMMARVLDLTTLRPVLEACRWNDVTLDVVFEVRDNLLAANNGPFGFTLEQGRLLQRSPNANAPPRRPGHRRVLRPADGLGHSRRTASTRASEYHRSRRTPRFGPRLRPCNSPGMLDAVLTKTPTRLSTMMGKESTPFRPCRLTP